jgi:hypothetical protein
MRFGRHILFALHRWLVSVFNAAELRRVVRHGPQGKQVAASLPENCSLDTLAFETMEAWSRHGVSRKALAEHLVRERPGRADELPIKKNASAKKFLARRELPDTFADFA